MQRFCITFVKERQYIALMNYSVIKERRALLGLTQQDLAEAVGVTRQTIVAIERGDYNPTIKLCVEICKALGKTLDQLFWEP